MPTHLPSELQDLLSAAVLHLWDKRRPAPDLDVLSDWLESDGWDEVVSGLNSSCIYASRIMHDLNDQTLLEHTDIESKKRITDNDRLSFAREQIDYLLSQSMDSCHSIQIEVKDMPPAELCFMMYYHPQGGASFEALRVCHSLEDYLLDCQGEVINDSKQLSDLEILALWRQSEADLKSWLKS